MDSKSSKSLPVQGSRAPPGLPPGIKVPTGPRSSIQAKKPGGPIGVKNKQVPSVLNIASLSKITYEEAIEDIMEHMGEQLADLESIPCVPTSVVLHNPRGGILKASQGPILQVDVSLCYLITWLQVFTDNYVEKYHPGNDLVVRSVEIRFNNKQTYTSYPNLEGGLSYFNANGLAAASVSWPCDNSLMEQFWEYFRSLMQLGGDDQIKYPIIKVRTVKYLAGEPDGIEVYKPLGSGHIFVVDGVDFDVDRYYLHHGQQIPASLIHLDHWLTEAENQQLAQTTAKQQQAQTGNHATQMPLPQGGPQNVGGVGRSGVGGPQHGQKVNMNRRAYRANAGEFMGTKPNLKTMNANGAGGVSELNPAYLLPSIRQQPFNVVSAPIGNYTMDVSVPFRPPIHSDPEKTWRKFQRSGGIPQLHNAFPLDHLVYDPKDMPEGPTPPPAMSSLGDEGVQYYMTSNVNNEKAGEEVKNANTNDQPNDNGGNKANTRTSKDAYNEIQAAIGFDSDDDDIFFPASCMEEKPQAVHTSQSTQPMHGHGHGPSKNENEAKVKQAQKHSRMNAHDSVAADSKVQSKAGLPGKKIASTMNVNAPEFVTNPAPMHQASGLDFMANPLASGYSNNFVTGCSGSSATGYSNPPISGYSNPLTGGYSNPQATGYLNPLAGGYSNPLAAGYSNPLVTGYSNQPPHDTSFASTMKYDPQSFAASNLQPFMPAPGHYTSYPAPYPPRYAGDPNSGSQNPVNPNCWALPVYKPTPIAPPKPATGPSSKKLPTNTVNQNSSAHQRGGTKENDSLLTTVDGLARRVARQTLSNPSQREAKKEDPSSKTGDNATASQAWNNADGSKGNMRRF